MASLSTYRLESPPWLKRIIDPAMSDARKRIVAWVLVFTAYLLTAQIGIYLYRDIGTSPALIWPPVGIAIVAVLIEGYWILSAIAVAALVNGLLAVTAPPYFIIFGSIIANTLQPFVGGYALRRLNFNPLMQSIRDVFLLVVVAMGATIIMPLINYGFAFGYNYLFEAARPLPAWTSIWMGGALSALVLIPFLSRWIGIDITARSKLQQFEALFTTLLVAGLSYLLFATALPSAIGTFVLLLLFAALFWVAFRTGPRMMTLSLLCMTGISLAGAIYGAHAPSQSGVEPTLSQRLINTQIFDLIFCFFFFILASVEEQRKEALKTSQEEAARLEKALETIRAEDNAKNEFIAVLAHELRNPLAPVISGLELLLMEETSPERTEVLMSARQQSMVMRRLLDELLDVARITRHSFTLYKEDVALQAILRQSIQSVQYFYKERGQVFTSDLPAENMYVHGDVVRLVQIFINLLYNAGKYTEKGGTISLALTQENGKGVVRLNDNGVGIEAESLTRIFDAFVHSRDSGRAGTGLGIGLSIAKHLVELHDGKVSAQSPGKGKGSTFTVELPLLLARKDGSSAKTKEVKVLAWVASPIAISESGEQ